MIGFMRSVGRAALVSLLAAALVAPAGLAGAQTQKFDGPRSGNPAPKAGATVGGQGKGQTTERRATGTPTRSGATGKPDAAGRGVSNKGTKGCDVC